MERLTEKETYCSFTDCDCKGKCKIANNCYDKQLYDKLKEYEDLEEQRLLIKLPCKVGDTIYHLECEGKIGEGICKAFQVDEENKMVWMEGKEFAFWVSFERFGKTVFLTKEEAEAKLKEMQDE